MKHTRPVRLPHARPTAVALAAAALAACSSGGSSDQGRPHSTNQSAVIGGPVEIVERFIAYLADEASTGAGGTDLNGDGDVIDGVAVVANAATKDERPLVAADDFAMVRTGASGTSLFLVVDEADDGVDWDGDTVQDDLVLLHTNLNTQSMVTFVETLGDDTIAKVGDRVYFQEDASVLVAPETALMYVTADAPFAPVQVSNADLANTLEPEILMADEGLLFLSLDEVTEGRDLNGDADLVDTDVLALLDATDASAAVVTVGLALQDDSTPLRALATGTTWIVAFLVDEAQQGGVNLNDPNLASNMFPANWQPPQCATFEDADALDQVLHFLDFDAFVLDPILDPPVNTGLVGDDRVLAVEGANSVFVATVSTEADEGTCDLNDDGDLLDDVLRWTEAVFPVLPFTNELEIQALASVAGTADNVAELSDRFVAVISESDDSVDYNGDGDTTDDLVAWLDPDDGSTADWEFDHTTPPPPPINAVGTGWFDAIEDMSDRVGVAFPEAFFLVNGNPTDINGDNDELDSVPTFVRFNAAGTELDFPGPAVAVADTNAGITIANDLGFYRVDENADDRDWNGDGDKTDFVLFRTTVSTMQGSFFISTLNNLAIPAVSIPDPTEPEIAVAFLADEAAQAEDFNNDGDTNDMVLRWFRID